MPCMIICVYIYISTIYVNINLFEYNKFIKSLLTFTCPQLKHCDTDLPRNTEDVGSIPDTGRYIVARMTT